MSTLDQFACGLDTLPMATSWLLQDLAEERGRQEKFEWQAPERLEALRQHALVESAVSSTRMEGVEIDGTRVRPVLVAGTAPRDRNEQEVRGYRDALERVHTGHASLELNEAFLLSTHRLVRAGSGDAGEYKQRTAPIIERHPDGSVRERFMPVDAAQAPQSTRSMLARSAELLHQRDVPPLLVACGVNLDLLCIHPFRDGNGRTSRVAFLLQLYHAGYDVGRFVSLERIIEQSKDRYYETLEHSSHGWHEGRHDPWPLINFLLYTVREAYREFVDRVGDVGAPKGAKSSRVHAAIDQAPDEFTTAYIEQQCPGISRDLIQKILRDRRDVHAARRGPKAPRIRQPRE